jgi:hypothetical protein
LVEEPHGVSSLWVSSAIRGLFLSSLRDPPGPSDEAVKSDELLSAATVHDVFGITPSGWFGLPGSQIPAFALEAGANL